MAVSLSIPPIAPAFCSEQGSEFSIDTAKVVLGEEGARYGKKHRAGLQEVSGQKEARVFS